MASFRGWLRRAPRQGPAARRPYRPAVEALEARDVPAVSFLTQPQILAVLGTAYSGPVASFRASTLDLANPGPGLANLHATIFWGDGHTSDGTISGPDANGVLQVSGSNPYQFPQRYAVGVTVHDDNDHTWNATTADLLVRTDPVNAARLSATVQAVTANAGESFNGVLAVISDPNPRATAGVIQVQVDYGDNTAPEAATVVAESTPGLYDVRGNHTYAQTGSFTVNISVHDGNNNTWAAASGTATVGPNPAVFTATGVNVAASAGRPFSGVVAIIQDTGGDAQAANLQPSINWGDGTGLTTGTVRPSANPGFFEVVGSHTFLLNGSDTVQVWVRDAGTGKTTSATATAAVAPPPPDSLTVNAVAVNAAPGTNYTGVVGVIQDSNPNVTATSLTAVVDWGDGSAPTVAPLQATGAPGFFNVLGSHTYAQAGSGQVRVLVQDSLDGLSAQDVAATNVMAGANPAPSPGPASANSDGTPGPSAPPVSPPDLIAVEQRLLMQYYAALLRRHHHLHVRLGPFLRTFFLAGKM